MRRGLVAFLAVSCIALGVPALRHVREQPPPPPPAVRLSFAAPPGVDPGFGDESLDAAISPDETAIVFVATHRDPGPSAEARIGNRQLWRRALDDERAEPLPGTTGAQQPAWKQTGNAISFFADGRLKQITLGDGIVHDLADAPAALGATWLADGSLLYASGNGPIHRLKDGQSTDATTLAPGDVAHVFPLGAGPGEFVYVAVRQDGRRTAQLAANGTVRELTTTSGHAALVGNHLLHVRDGVLLAYDRDRESGDLSPRGVPVGVDVGVSAAGRALFAASPTLLLHVPGATRPTEVVWLDFAGVRGSAVAEPGDYWQVRLSRDDRQAAVAAIDPLLRAFDIAVASADGSAAVERVTLALAADTDPVWSPDGNRLLFRSMEGGTPDLFTRRIRQSEPASEVIFRSDLDETPTDWLGDRILFQVRGRTSVDVMVLQAGTGRYEPVAETPFNETDARWSPDGRWIAFVSDEAGRPDVYLRRPDGTRLRVSFAGGRRPRWTRDGRAILFLRGSQMMRADLVGGDAPRIAPARVLFDAPGIRDFDIAHGSDRVIALLPVATDARPAIGAVLNWTSLLRSAQITR